MPKEKFVLTILCQADVVCFLRCMIESSSVMLGRTFSFVMSSLATLSGLKRTASSDQKDSLWLFKLTDVSRRQIVAFKIVRSSVVVAYLDDQRRRPRSLHHSPHTASPPLSSIDAEPAQVRKSLARSRLLKIFSSRNTPAGLSSTVSRICLAISYSVRACTAWDPTSPLMNAAIAFGTPNRHPPIFTHEAICFSVQSGPPSPKPFASAHLRRRALSALVTIVSRVRAHFKNHSVTVAPILCETSTVFLPLKLKLCSISVFSLEKYASRSCRLMYDSRQSYACNETIRVHLSCRQGSIYKPLTICARKVSASE